MNFHEFKGSKVYIANQGYPETSVSNRKTEMRKRRKDRRERSERKKY